MPNNELIERPKLNIFQKVRKYFLMKRITVEKYDTAPEYLKNDYEVIDNLMQNPLNISHLSEEHALNYLEQNQDVFKKLDKNLQNRFLSKKPELFTALDDSTQKSFILDNWKYEYLKYLPIKEQLEYLTQVKERTDNFSQLKIKIKPEFFADKLSYFNEEVLFKAIKIHSDAYNEKNRNSQDDKKRTAYYDAKSFYQKLNLSDLSEKTKLKLALLDNRLIEKIDDETRIKFVNNNPLLFEMLPHSKKIDITEYKLKTFQEPQMDIDYNETIKISSLNYDSYFDLGNITNSIKNKDILWEVAKTIPQALAITGIRNDSIVSTKNTYVKDLFKSKISNQTILNAIDQSKYFGCNVNMYKDKVINTAICKILTDERIVTGVEPNKIAEFVKNPSMNLMRELIIETYGENAKKVLDSRPGLSMESIPNTRIFDETIFKEFGESTVHNQLSYNTKYSILLADFANHPEKIANYKKFERLVDGLFIKNSAGNEEKFTSYIELSDLISNLDERDMTPKRIDALKLIITDRKLPETRTLPLNSLEDIDNYIQARNKMYDDAMQKITNEKTTKEIISRRLFGMPYTKNKDGIYRASTLNMQDLLHYYSIDNFLNDKRTYESDLFSRKELASIELANIISKIEDPKALKKIYKTLSKREDVIGPVQFETVKQRIPLQYSRELISQLLSSQKALERINSGEQGISIENSKDGADIIKLKGADFKIMMHSFIGEGQTNSGFYIPSGTSKEELWKYFEEGCSTISNCVIEPNMLKSCGSDEDVINFGFSTINPKLIIGMSHHDAHISHLRRAPDPHFEYSSVAMNYPEELLRKTAAQITGQEAKDQTHEYNEVATYRHEQDSDKITSDNIGGKIMPDYIVVYGKSNSSHIELAKTFAKDGKPIPIVEIYREHYRDNMYFRANKEDIEHKIKSKTEPALVQEVKNIINNK